MQAAESKPKKKKSQQMSHLKALLKKNFIIMKRNKCGTCCELVTPIVFSFILVLVRGLIPVDILTKKSYATSTQPADLLYKKTFYATPSYFDATKITPADILKENRNLAKKNMMKNCQNEGVALIMNNNIGSNILTTLASEFVKMKIETKYFASPSQFKTYVQSISYGKGTNKNMCLGIQIDKDDAQGFEYQLRFNVTYRRRTSDIYQTSKKRIQPLVVSALSDLSKYQSRGFLALQNWIDNLNLKSRNAGASITPTVTSMTTKEHSIDMFSERVQQSTDFYLVLPLLAVFTGLVKKLLTEKELKIREGMKMMGMSNSSFYLSWVITYFILLLVIISTVSYIVVYQVLGAVGFFIFFWIYLMFAITLIFQAIFISVFFTKAKPGIVCAFVFFLVQYLLRSFLSTDATVEAYQYISFSPHTNITLAINTMLSFQFNLTPVSFDNYDIMIENYSIKTAYDTMWFNMIFWMIISLYLDQVFPNEFGQKKHPLFFLSFLKSKSKKIEDTEIAIKDKQDEENCEKVDQQQLDLAAANQVVSIKDMTKVYGSGKKAVNNLSLDMYLNQIFVLLGHNGAGKTSTISILSGLLNYSSGSASIFGKDISNEMEDIRQMMGVCPQHDILFDNMTVKEHLELFAVFKGSDNNKETQQEIDKMIMDLGLEEKKNQLAKTLSGGQKRRLSVGIAFIGNSKFIVLDEPTSGMDTSARRHIWEMLKNYKNDRIILLTTHFMDEADNLGDRIAIMSHGQLKCCGSSVFLKNKFGVGYNLSISKKGQESTDKIMSFITDITPQAKRISDVSSEEIYQLPLTCVPQFERLFSSLDGSLGDLGIESYGISITTLEEVFLSVNEGKKQAGSQMSQEDLASKYNSNRGEGIDVDQIDYDFKESYLPPLSRFFNIFKILVWKRLIYFKRDKKGLFMELVLPIILIILGCALLTVQFIIPQPSLQMEMSVYESQNIVYSGISSITTSSMNALMSLTGQKNTFYSPPAGTEGVQLAAFDSHQFSVYDRNQHGAVWFSSMTNNLVYSYMLLVNTVAPESASIYMNSINQAIFRTVTSTSEFSLKTLNNPMPLTFNQANAQQTTSGIVASMVFTLAIGFIPASIIVFIVKERESKIKHQQLVSGVSLSAYWFSNFFVDFIKYLIFAFATVGIIQAFQIEVMTDPENFEALVYIHILNGSSMIAFLYFFQFLFKTYSNAQLVIFIIYNLCGTIFSIVFLILKFFEDTRYVARDIATFLRLFPCFTYGYSLINNTNIIGSAIAFDITPRGALAWENNGQDIFFLGITTVMYMGLVFMIEYLQSSRKVSHKGKAYEQHGKDSDVQEEETLIAQGDPKDYSVMVNRLRKVYKENNKVAVDQVSFGLEQGGVFGLLGVNGAGKTTTFKMLTGDILPSSGEAYIHNHDIGKEQQKTRQFIGYCPQFDALLENVTVKEHLQLYAAIKCIPQEKRQSLVNLSLFKMDLNEFKDVLSKELSGGNKRKLSVAIAMLGNPPVIFLDEPSTGMDPQARRFMWTVISNITTHKKQSSVILTTHSMEEAEALCTKMGIMVNGELKCLGSIQHLKSRFGKGYELEVKFKVNEQTLTDQAFEKLQPEYSVMSRVNLEQTGDVLYRLGLSQLAPTIAVGKQGSHLYMELKNTGSILIDNLVDFALIEQRGEQLCALVEQTFGEMAVVEHFSLFYRLKVINQQKVGQLFAFFIAQQEAFGIEQYSVKQTSIEQIFNMFAKDEIGYQLQKDGDNQEVQDKYQQQAKNQIEIENIGSSEDQPLKQ